MSSSCALERRAVLQKSKARLFDLVCENASEEQWAEWLMVPLEHAAAAGDSVLVNDLLASGASWKAGWRGCHDRTLLCAAVQGGNVEMVKDVLKAGARTDVDLHEDKEGRVPLHYAVENGHEAIVKLLLINGASPNRKDGDGVLPIHTAVSQGFEEVVSLLLVRGGGQQVLYGDGYSLLHVAAHKGHTSVASVLLMGGANVRLGDSRGRSALDLAATGGHVDVIRALVQHGANVTSCRTAGYTALHHAAYNDQPDAVDVLVEFGCSLEALTAKLGTPLYVAAHQGSCGALVALLRHNANIHAKGHKGRSPLMAACTQLHLEAADLLLRWGADETLVDNEGRSADQLVVAGVKWRDRGGKQQDMETMHKLLANAPADRAWRRRGWLVLCRAFPHKAWFGLASSQDGADSIGEDEGGGSRTRATVRRKIQQMDESIDTGDDAKTNSSAAACADRAEGIGCVGPCSIEARVVELEQSSVFRIIVSFL